MAINDKGFAVPDGIAADAIILQQRKNPEGKLANYILLIKRGKPGQYQGFWALPGGFCEYEEELFSCCIREIKEELGVDLTGYSDEKPRDVISGPFRRDYRGWIISVPFMFLLPTDQEFNFKAGDDAGECSWVLLSDALDKINLAFDHCDIINDCIPQHIKWGLLFVLNP